MIGSICSAPGQRVVKRHDISKIVLDSSTARGYGKCDYSLFEQFDCTRNKRLSQLKKVTLRAEIALFLL